MGMFWSFPGDDQQNNNNNNYLKNAFHVKTHLKALYNLFLKLHSKKEGKKK